MAFVFVCFLGVFEGVGKRFCLNGEGLGHCFEAQGLCFLVFRWSGGSVGENKLLGSFFKDNIV